MTLIESRQPSTEREVEVIVPLEDRRQRIVATLESAAIDIGRELIGAKKDHQGCFLRWVEDELPFGIDKAERLMAITRAFDNADPEIRQALPSAYTAMCELARLPHDRLRAHIESGDVHPDMTVREARALHQPDPIPLPEPTVSPLAEPRIAADVIATELIRHPRSTLSDDIANVLAAWLG